MSLRISIGLIILGVVFLVSSTYFYENNDNGYSSLSDSVASLVAVINPSNSTSDDGYKVQSLYINEDLSILGLLVLSMIFSLVGVLILLWRKRKKPENTYSSLITLGIGSIGLTAYYLSTINLNL